MRTARGSSLLLAAVLVCLGLGLPASAAVPDVDCPADGATVLVEFGDLAPKGEPSVRTSCDDDVEGERVAQTLVDAGFSLTYATRSPGFVCRVDGVPADDPCVNASPSDAYWSVWWAEAGGEWVYSSRGVGTLRTPVGGHVALVWHSGKGKAAPPEADPGTVSADTSAASTSAAAEEVDGLPAWVPAVVVLVLVGAVVAVVLVRRRQV